MELDAREVLRVLREKGVTTLHHANSVRTACSFLRKGKLLSRGTLDELGLPQADQQTDALDQAFGLWYDIFVDTVDIHYRARTRNNYGPVLFELNLEVFEQDWLAYVWVTKSNPSNWTQATPYEDRYFRSIQELSDNFVYGNFDKLFVLRSAGGVLRLNQFLNRIVIDRTDRTLNGVRAYDQAVGALRASCVAGSLNNIEITSHACQTGCRCSNQYTEMSGQVFEKFFKP